MHKEKDIRLRHEPVVARGGGTVRLVNFLMSGAALSGHEPTAITVLAQNGEFLSSTRASTCTTRTYLQAIHGGFALVLVLEHAEKHSD